MDIFAPNPDSCKPPLVIYGDECRYCGACRMRCPCRKKDALTIVVPPAMRVSIKNAEMVMRSSLARKETRIRPARFTRIDYPEQDDKNFFCFLSQRRDRDGIRFSPIPVG